MMSFGTAGFPNATPKNGGVIEALETIKKLGLDGMELEFVRGVWLKREKTSEIKDFIEKNNLFLTCHAPYYINLNPKEPEKLEASKKRIIQSAERAFLSGAHSVTFHAGFYLKQDPSEVKERIKQRILDIRKELDDKNIGIKISPETTGKPSQFGSLEELLDIADLSRNIGICIDFSHLHARTNGKINSYEEFIEVLNKVEEKLGDEALKNLHLHISGIEYGEKGEKRHLNFPEADFNYKELMRALKDKNCSGTVTCESPNLEEDALRMKEYYVNL